MSMKARVIAVWVSLLASVAVFAGGLYLGYQWSENGWLEREQKWLKAVNDERERQQKDLGRVQAEVERLRTRPERVKVVVQKEIERVVADAECSSLPGSTRRLWNAEPDDPAPPGTARVGDEALRVVAANDR